MRTNPGVAAAIFEALADAGINIEIISTSSIRVSCVVPAADCDRAVNVIHERLKLADVFYEPPRPRPDAGGFGTASPPTPSSAALAVAVKRWYRIRSWISASDSERCRSLPIVNSPRRSERRWLAKWRPDQIISSIASARSRSRLPGDEHVHLVADLGDLDPAGGVGLAVEDRAEVGMLERRPQHELGVEVLLVAGGRQERDDDVGVCC